MSEPLKELLDRHPQEPIRPVVDAAAAMLDECVNYGTNLVVSCDKGASAIQGHMEAVVLLGLHVVEVVDAIAILIRHCSVNPAKNLLRSQMEAMFGIEYIAKGDRERKAVQYLVAHAHSRMDWYRKLDPTSATGRQLSAQLRKDSTFNELRIVELDTTANVDNLRKMLARQEYADVEAEWQRVRQQRQGQIWWYSLFRGPERIEDLATAVGDHAWYEILYRIYSGEVHATNAIDSLHATHEVSKGTYQPLRYPTDLPTVAQLATSMAVRSYNCLVRMLCPDEGNSFAHWYLNEVQPKYDSLLGCKIVDPTRPSKTLQKRSS
ncbi:MAG: DUF5677 domain-containing protein [Candidatus Sulfotelmatobacter sp.]